MNKKLIQKSLFHSLIESSKVPKIRKEYINEFSIGKNFFYEIKNYSELITFQERLNRILNNIDLNNSAIAFRKKHSYLNLFEPHRKNYNFIRLDIKGYFYSILIEDIKKAIEPYIDKDDYIDKDKKQSLLDAFINTITYTIPEDSKNKRYRGKNVLPMGFKTSPVISNIIFRKLDIVIQKLCIEKGITYTRYADDMLFSSIKEHKFVHSDRFIEDIKIILKKMNFRLNKHKTVKSKHTLSLNGYTIQHSKFYNHIFMLEEKIYEIRLSNKKINLIKKLIYHVEKGDKSLNILNKIFNYKVAFKYLPTSSTLHNYYDEQLFNKIIGYRAYLLSILEFNKRYNCTSSTTINKYSELINKLDSLVD